MNEQDKELLKCYLNMMTFKIDTSFYGYNQCFLKFVEELVEFLNLFVDKLEINDKCIKKNKKGINKSG